MRSFCRICCLDGLDNNAVSLDHRSEISSKTVLNMLAFVTGLKVHQGDSLPQQICRMCLGQLLISYELKRTSIASHLYFTKLLTEDCVASSIGGVESEFLNDQDASKLGDEVMHFCCWKGACTEYFKGEDQLIAHFELIHKETKDLNEVMRATDEFVCKICARGFDDEEELLRHSSLVKRKALKCHLCPFVTYYQAEFNFHKRIHTASFSCVCGYLTNRKYSLQRHLATICCEEIYGQKVSCEPIWNNHPRLERASTKMPPPEEKCDLTDSELVALDFSVMHTRHRGKSYCCISECQVAHDSELQCIQHYEETHAAELSRSVKDESGEDEPLKCRICRKVFQVEKDLEIHREESFQPLFQCNTCGTDGLRRGTALAHSQKACTGKRFSCPCGFLTNEPSSLETHYKSGICDRSLGLSEGVETEEEASIGVLSVVNAEQVDSKLSPSVEQRGSADRYVCEYCGVVKTTAENLRNHHRFEKVRTLQLQTAFDSGREVDGVPGKMYNCKWCNQPTNNVTHLVKCMVNAKQNLRCKKCFKQFYSKTKLKLHDMRGCRSRMVERCPYCEKRFYNSSNLKRHITWDHQVDWKLRDLDPTRKFVCTICGYRFRRNFSLKRHTLLHNRKPKSSSVVKQQASTAST